MSINVKPRWMLDSSSQMKMHRASLKTYKNSPNWVMKVMFQLEMSMKYIANHFTCLIKLLLPLKHSNLVIWLDKVSIFNFRGFWSGKTQQISLNKISIILCYLHSHLIVYHCIHWSIFKMMLWNSLLLVENNIVLVILLHFRELKVFLSE